jgi:aldose 1-epimerase
MKHFGQLPDGAPVDLYTLKSAQIEVSVTNYGAHIVAIRTPDRNGKTDDVALGYDTLAEYVAGKPFFGAMVGRYANRIAKGSFTLDGQRYQLAQNDGMNSLHGGRVGFDKRLWQGHVETTSVVLTYVSPDGEEGYPGALHTTVRYTVSGAELRIDYLATTDRDTVLNLSNHTYFNLAGAGSGPILDHRVTLYADRFTPVDATLIPTGELRAVAGTPFDFRQAHPIGERIEGTDEQLRFGHGYDHNWVLNGYGGDPKPAARVYDPKSGRVLEVLTSEPGLQFYTANFLDGTTYGKGGKQYTRRSAFCMETQHFPDSPNHPSFPSTVLKPGQTFRSTTIFRFSTES